jgi:hypothetical protein
VVRRAVAEALGTAFLLAAVVGSGIMGERLAGGNVAIALLANTIATGAILVTLILTFGPISGAHFNPAVTLADASQGGLAWREVPVYLGAQIAGAFAGVATAHLMFGEPLFFASRHVRAGSAQLFSEFVATFGLVSVIWGCARLRSSAVPFTVGAYITGHRSKSVDEFARDDFDYVLTVCDSAKESCPVYSGHANRLHHSFDDPAGLKGSEDERLSAFRRVRDEIRTYLRGFPGDQRPI